VRQRPAPAGFLFEPQMRLDQFPSGFANALHGGISTLLHFDLSKAFS
jgi:hypothetical protein